jgi:hypothetical protein
MKRLEKKFDFESRPMPVNGCLPCFADYYRDMSPPPGAFSFSPLQNTDWRLIKQKESTYRILYHIRTKPGFEEYYVLVKYDAETDQVAGKIVGQKEADAFQRKAPAKKRTARKIDVAKTLLTQHPEWDEAKIARNVPCDPSYLSKNSEYQKWAETVRQAMARQHRQAVYDARTKQRHPTITDPEVDC